MSSDTVKSFTGILYLFSECNFHLFLYWSSSDTLLSSDWILGPALSYAICTYETRYWAQPFPIQFEHMGSIGPPHIILVMLIKNDNKERNMDNKIFVVDDCRYFILLRVSIVEYIIIHCEILYIVTMFYQNLIVYC